jgi:CRP-like cAMP-binding protein
MKADYSTQGSSLLMPLIVPAESKNNLLAQAILSIPMEERLILGLSLSRIRLAAGAPVFDGEIDRVLFLEKGIAAETIHTSGGNALGISIIGREGAVGLRGMIFGARGFEARALTPLEAIQISARALKLACSRSRELDSLLRHYSQSLFVDSMLAMACHYHHGLSERLLRWLLTVTDRLGSNKLSVTQEILAETLGVTQGAISPILDALESKGLIERTRKEIIVLDRGRLLRKACRCYSARSTGHRDLNRENSREGRRNVRIENA